VLQRDAACMQQQSVTAASAVCATLGDVMQGGGKLLVQQVLPVTHAALGRTQQQAVTASLLQGGGAEPAQAPQADGPGGSLRPEPPEGGGPPGGRGGAGA
jgi:hypothetical protein